jgi:putative Holliday junction resolvase
LALDFGTRRVGAALSDPRREIATPLEAYRRIAPDLDANHYRSIVRTFEVKRIVVGLPLHTDGTEGEVARQARAWGAWLAETTGLPVFFYDERFTTAEAEEILREHGFRLKDRKHRRDMLAARILLQDYLEAGCPDTELPPEPLSD